MTNKRIHRIASIPGDGIGKEVIPEGLRVLQAAASKFGFEHQVDSFDFACVDYYETHGRMMPADWNQRLQPYNAILFGAVGWPERVPDHISLWGSLVQFRRQFDQYVSLRPVRLMPGVTSPLARPGEIDFVIVRENTEGEYSEVSFADCSFDVVLCNLGLMFFPDAARGLSEFRRVLRPGGRVAVSVNTVVERSYNHQINVIIARYMPSLAEAVTRTFALSEASLLRSLFNEAGFADFQTHTVRHTFVVSSFDAYYGPFERGGASTGQALAALPEEIRAAVRDEVRRDLSDRGGPIEAEAEYRIASARR
jgi:SAM-dependent methyltransferase